MSHRSAIVYVSLALAAIACGSNAEPVDTTSSATAYCPTYNHCNNKEAACYAEAGVITAYNCYAKYYHCVSEYYYCNGNAYMGCLYQCDAKNQWCEYDCVQDDAGANCDNRCKNIGNACAATCPF